ncbi:MAG: helix-turn-helix domain-containing protein [Proteobacteria bacterium]|nr:helix-turn-helix domain-containing protein [Pseudomonadota bacterium]
MTAPDVSEFAAALKAGREAAGLSVHQVAGQLLLSEMQVVGLENDDLGVFYGVAYAERAAKAYAARLGLPDSLQGGPPYSTAHSIDAQATPLLDGMGSAVRIGPHVPRGAIAVLVLLLLVGAGWSVRHFVMPANQPAMLTMPDTLGVAPAEASAPVSAPVPVPTEAAPVVADVPAAAEPEQPVDQTPGQSMDIEADRGDKRLRFYLVIDATAVVNAFDGEGNRLLGGRHSPMPGQSYYGTPPFSVQTNDAEAIELYYMGARIRPMQDANGGYSTRFGSRP